MSAPGRSRRAWDVLIVGARCAGSPLAMLLARAGLRVLVVDRARFPSPVISTHLILVPGVASLRRWGLWPAVRAAGAAVMSRSRVTTEYGVLDGPWPTVGGFAVTANLRRHLLDEVLVNAARGAGAEVRERTRLTGVTWSRAEALIELECGGRSIVERARFVVGADGKRSKLAQLVGAETYRETGPLTASFYAYVEDADRDGNVAELWSKSGYELLFVPTDSGLSVANVVVPIARLEEFQCDLVGAFERSYDAEPGLGDRLRRATRVSRIYVGLDLRNFYRRPYGDGWALVGDAGHAKDPVRAQGITDAFLDAEALAGALVDGLGGGTPLDASLGRWHYQRDRRTAEPFEMCLAACRLDHPTSDEGRAFHKLCASDPGVLAAARGLIDGSTSWASFEELMAAHRSEDVRT